MHVRSWEQGDVKGGEWEGTTFNLPRIASPSRLRHPLAKRRPLTHAETMPMNIKRKAVSSRAAPRCPSSSRTSHMWDTFFSALTSAGEPHR
jgi:hypothetical protein